MKKIYSSLCFLFLMGIIIQPVYANTPTSNSALIQVLLEKLNELQLQLDDLLQERAQSTPVTNSYTKTTQPTLDTFPKVTNPWSANIRTTDIPTDAYKAHYFNTKNPTKMLITKTVPAVAVSYAWDDIGIISEDFGGYWIGKISVPATGRYLVSTAESWSESRVIINNRIIKTQSEDAVPIFLEKGQYTIEVEYVNNWHTTGFSMNLLPEQKNWTREALARELKNIAGTNANTYVGVYESANENREVTVDLKNSNATGILYLAAYSQVNWVIKNASSIKAVVVGSYEKGTQVQGVPSGVPVYYTDYESLPQEYSLEENCDTYEDFISACEYIYQLTSIDEALMAISGKKLSSFTGEYAADVLLVPGMVINDVTRANILKSYEAAVKEAEAKKQNNRIDNIFR